MATKPDVATATKNKPRSGFTQIFNAFLDTDLLNQYEKLVFIAIKSYSNNKTKQAYPSLATISRVTGTSISQVRRSIKHMEELGVLDIQHRKSERFGNVQNLYTIHDDPKIWSVTATEDDDIEAVAQEISDAKLIAELEKRGYSVTKSIKKEPTTEAGQSTEGGSFINSYSTDDTSTTNAGRQATYSMEALKNHFNYDEMIEMQPMSRTQIDYVMQIIYDTVNSNAETIRVQKTNRPKQVVTGVLMKLKSDEIMYVIDKYRAQTNRIKYPKAYLLTQLYEAKGQYEADVTNEVQNDMNGGSNGAV